MNGSPLTRAKGPRCLNLHSFCVGAGLGGRNGSLHVGLFIKAYCSLPRRVHGRDRSTHRLNNQRDIGKSRHAVPESVFMRLDRCFVHRQRLSCGARKSGSQCWKVKRDLADLMLVTQLRHAKLFYAGRDRNWSLADYQLRQLDLNLKEAQRSTPAIDPGLERCGTCCLSQQAKP